MAAQTPTSLKNHLETIETHFASLQNLFRNTKKHPRYTARCISLSTILIGSILNFVSLVSAFLIPYNDPPKIVTACASVVLGISFAYQIADLLSASSSSSSPKPYHIPSTYLFAIDTLGFLSFLTLLIVNGIFLYSALYIYNSVPWIFCCAIHLFTAATTLPRLIRDFAHSNDVYCCAECRREVKKKAGKPDDGAEGERGLLLQHHQRLQEGPGESDRDVENGL